MPNHDSEPGSGVAAPGADNAAAGPLALTDISRRARALYIRNIGLAFLLVGSAAIVQMNYVYQDVEAHLFGIPALVALVVGVLLARVSLLKEQLARESARFHAMVDVGREFMYYRTAGGRYEFASPSSVQLTGYSPEEFYAKPTLLNDLILPEDRPRWESHVREVEDGGRADSMDLRLIHKNGHIVWFQHRCAPVYDRRGRLIGLRAANIDITERKNAEARIERMAYYDPLTDLPNRRALTEEINTQIQSCSGSDQHFAILFMDLDRFKHINDTYGHELGDALLGQLAGRLKRCCEERGLIARFGGDEIVMLVPKVGDPNVAIDYAARVLNTIEHPFIIDDRELFLSGCIGITLYPYDGADAATLLRNADAAMYRAKQDKHTRIRPYSEDLIDNVAAFISTENRLRRALRENEFTPYYQAQVEMASGRIIGAEALARWESHDRGLIPPNEFIPVAEETGLIADVGQSILEQACRQAIAWRRLGQHLPVSVNISGRQFTAPGFVSEIADVIRRTGVDPSQLELEITEQVFLDDMKEATRKLWQLRDLGVSIAIDDFGVGYSSLSYLKRLPFNTLKIDRAFTRDICEDTRDVAILRAILSLSGDLNLYTVIEGVETEQQRSLLLNLGCDRAQGFLFHKPLPAEAMTPLLTEGG